MDSAHQLELVLRILAAVLLGAAVGVEREWTGHPAGLRTMAAVSMGSALYTLAGTLFPHSDPTRVAAQVVTGIGFLGAGTIVRGGGGIRGLTTAATIWLVAAIGMAAGFGYYVLAGAATVIMLGVLVGLRLVEDRAFPANREHEFAEPDS